MKYLKAICLVFLVAFLSACSGGSSAEEKLGGGACGALRAKVFNGEECSQVARTPVVAIYSLALSGDQIVPAGICSGTLISVDDVLIL